MPKKAYVPGNRTCRVTFELPADVKASEVCLLGEFNDWKAVPLTPRKGGRFSITLSLPRERTFRYRYLIDGNRWENDWEADGYQPNAYGGDDSIVTC
jgi:1,4-alpha-glucan branching enzyme